MGSLDPKRGLEKRGIVGGGRFGMWAKEVGFRLCQCG